MVSAMEDLERTWNHKFNYPWTFFNDVPFTEEFKRRTKAATHAECRYGRSPFCSGTGSMLTLRRGYS
jgi:mannosyltransferase